MVNKFSLFFFPRYARTQFTDPNRGCKVKHLFIMQSLINFKILTNLWILFFYKICYLSNRYLYIYKRFRIMKININWLENLAYLIVDLIRFFFSFLTRRIYFFLFLIGNYFFLFMTGRWREGARVLRRDLLILRGGRGRRGAQKPSPRPRPQTAAQEHQAFAAGQLCNVCLLFSTSLVHVLV